MQPYYQAHGITIYHSRCEDVLPQLKADVVITDPPYNAGKVYGKSTNDRRPWPEWCEWWDGILDLMQRSAPDVFAFLSQTSHRRYLRLGKYAPDWTLIWFKPLSMAVCAMPFMPHWEPIDYWGKTRRRKGKMTSKDGNFWGSDVLTCNVTPNRYGHPTEKPLLLMRELVGRFQGSVLDPFMGSGTTLRAARELGRSAIGVEVEEAYCEIAARRVEAEVVLPNLEQYPMVMEGV